MQRLIYSSLTSPLKRRILVNKRNPIIYQYSYLSNTRAISTTNKTLKIENNAKNLSDNDEKILISNIEGRTKEELKKSIDDEIDEPPPSPKKKILKRLPSRHSRNQAPTIASYEIVDDMTKELISSPVGSWYTYDPDFTTKDDDDDQGFIVSDVWTQKVEFLLRGHSSLLDGSIIRDELQREQLELPTADENDDKRVNDMKSLLERIENEAEAYKEAYIFAHSALEKTTPKKNKHMTSASEEEGKETSLFKGSTPGPTISMYDLVLDAHAISTLPTAIASAQVLFNKALHRHILDGGPDNTNRDTIPTALTFNAVIRAASNTSYDSATTPTDEQKRDEALNAAFYTFDKMYHTDATDRNTATYIYMLRMLKKVMPESRVRGNIAHALFDLAVEDKVMDESIYEELKVNGGGELYENWLRFMSEKEVPVEKSWRLNSIKRRYHVDSNIY